MPSGLAVGEYALLARPMCVSIARQDDVSTADADGPLPRSTEGHLDGDRPLTIASQPEGKMRVRLVSQGAALVFVSLAACSLAACSSDSHVAPPAGLTGTAQAALLTNEGGLLAAPPTGPAVSLPFASAAVRAITDAERSERASTKATLAVSSAKERSPKEIAVAEAAKLPGDTMLPILLQLPDEDTDFSVLQHADGVTRDEFWAKRRTTVAGAQKDLAAELDKLGLRIQRTFTITNRIAMTVPARLIP